MTQISHDAGQLRKPDGVWQVNVAKRVFAAIDSYAWWQVIHWIRSKHHRITWKQLRRRFTAPNGRIAADGIVLTGASKIKIRRYRYRRHKIPAPWITQAVTP